MVWGFCAYCDGGVFNILRMKELIMKRSISIFAVIILGILFISWSLFKASMRIQNDVINVQTFVKYNILNIFKRLAAILYEYQRHFLQ